MIKQLDGILQFATFGIHGEERIPNKKGIAWGAIKIERWRLLDDTGMDGRTKIKVSISATNREKRAQVCVVEDRF